MQSALAAQLALCAAPAQRAPLRRAAAGTARPARTRVQARCAADTSSNGSEPVSLSRRAVTPLLFALSAAAALPAPALAGLASYDTTGRGVLEASMALGSATDPAFAFYPNELSFEQGRVYKLHLSNPSSVEHYFSAPTFAAKVFTILVEVAGTEVKGAVTEMALEPGQSLTWIFVPMRAGRYPLLCPVAGHVEGGMIGALTITAPAK